MIVLYVILRYIRLTALLAVVILLEIYIFPVVIRGPFAYEYAISGIIANVVGTIPTTTSAGATGG